MSKNWEKLDEKKQIKFLHNGSVVIIKPSLEDKNLVPLFCNLCELPMKDSEDFYSFREFQCCKCCELSFARTNRVNWNNGWRPDKNSNIWLEYIKNRKDSFSPIIQFV